MVDRAMAERDYPLLQSVGGPLSVLTEFDVSDRSRFKRLIRAPAPHCRNLAWNIPADNIGRMNCEPTWRRSAQRVCCRDRRRQLVHFIHGQALPNLTSTAIRFLCPVSPPRGLRMPQQG